MLRGKQEARHLVNRVASEELAHRLSAEKKSTVRPHHIQVAFSTALNLLENPTYFNSLKILSKSQKVRLFEFAGQKFVIKDTRGDEMQGFRYEKLRAAFLAHQKLVRAGKIKPQRYELRSIKVVKTIGNYLIMNYKEGKNLPNDFDAPVHEELRKAYEEMKTNMGEAKKGVLFYAPQYIDVIIAKEPILGDPKRAKFVFYLPYDHT